MRHLMRTQINFNFYFIYLFLTMKRFSLLAWLLIITMWLTACGNKSYDMSFEDALATANSNSSQLSNLILNTEYFLETIDLNTTIENDWSKINMQFASNSKQNLSSTQSDSNFDINLGLISPEGNLTAKANFDVKLLTDNIYFNLTNLELTGDDENLAMIPALTEWFKNQRFSLPLSWAEWMTGLFDYLKELQNNSSDTEVIINEGSEIYNGKFSDYQWFNAWKYSLDSEKLAEKLNEYSKFINPLSESGENIENILSSEVQINNFEWYLVIYWKNKVATIIENMDIVTEDVTINMNLVTSNNEIKWTATSEWNTIMNFEAIKHWSKYNISANILENLIIDGTISPKVSESDANISFDIIMNIISDEIATDSHTLSIPLKWKWKFNPVSEFSVEAPAESISIIDLLGSYLGAGVLDDYEAEDYSEDENYDIVTSYEDTESLEENIIE